MVKRHGQSESSVAADFWPYRGTTKYSYYIFRSMKRFVCMLWRSWICFVITPFNESNINYHFKTWKYCLLSDAIILIIKQYGQFLIVIYHDSYIAVIDVQHGIISILPLYHHHHHHHHIYCLEFGNSNALMPRLKVNLPIYRCSKRFSCSENIFATQSFNYCNRHGNIKRTKEHRY